MDTYLVMLKGDSNREFEFEAGGFDVTDKMVMFYLEMGGGYTYMFLLDSIAYVMRKQEVK
tara:strand:- start:846 stop:1025 length:180 start_codon:yes stop_codon:yes gene_type:complete